MPEPSADLLERLALGGARVRETLVSGPVADAWLLERGSETLVLRRDRELAFRLGLDRDAEWHMLGVAWAAGLGPKPVHRAPGVLVTGYLDGDPWRRAATPSVDTCRALGLLLRRVHETPVAGGKRFDLSAIASRYAAVAGGVAARAQAVRIADLAAPLYADAPWCLCHHDPHLGNVVGQEAPRLIDWEYAALGHPLFDLAVVVRHHGIGQEPSEALIRGWAGDAPLVPFDAFDLFLELYDAVAGLWARAVGER